MKYRDIILSVLFFALMSLPAHAFSTLSVGQADIISNDPTINGPAWLLTVTENGNNQYAVGNFAASTIKDSNGNHSKYDLKLEITNTQNTCQYTFANTYVPIYNIQVKAYSFWDTLTGADVKDCLGNPLHVAYNSEVRSATAYCYLKQQSGQVVDLSTPNTLITSTIVATANGQVATGTVSSLESRSVNLADPSTKQVYATASWQGNLESGVQCKNPVNAPAVIGVSNNGNFQLSDRTAYEQYDSTTKTLFTCLGAVGGGNFLPTHDQYLQCVSDYNARSNALLTKTSSPAWVNATIANGQVNIIQPNLLQYPVITFRAKVSWLGIVVPVGIPKIVSADTQAFTEGSDGNIHVVIQNIADCPDCKGAFSVSSNCADIASQSSISRTLKLDPKATGSVDLPISCKTTGKEVTTTCTITAQDMNNPDNKDTRTVSADCKPLAICQAGATRCNNAKTVQVCNDQGSAWNDQTVCPEACQINNKGLPECITSGGAIDTTTQPPPPEAPFPWKLVGFGIALLVFGIATYFFASSGLPIPAVITGLLTLASLIGVIIGFFSLFSLLAAWLLTIGIILILAGVGLLEWAPEISLVILILGVILILLGIMLFFTCTNPSYFWKAIGVCS